MNGRSKRKMWRAFRGLPMGAGILFACLSSAEAGAGGQTPTTAGATVPTSDAGATSTFVWNAQRGQVVPPEIGDVERMCALLTSCDKLPIPSALVPDDFSACVKKMSDGMSSVDAINFSLTMRECGLQADSCGAFKACAMHGASIDACSGRGKQGVVSFCDVDGRALTCWHDQTVAVRDCPRGGEQCLVVGGQATCSLGPCPANISEGDRPRCSASGAHLVHCDRGKLASLDCAAFGLKCSTSADGSAGCSTGAATCTGGPVHCDGNVAVGCVNGHEVKVLCGAVGLVCNQSAAAGTAIGACAAPPVPVGGCDPGDRPRCDDGNIKYCAAGRARTFSCRALGFGRCEASKSGLRCAL